METRLYNKISQWLKVIGNTIINLPTYVPDNLKWFERDGLETWYRKNKCDNFLEDTDSHFKSTRIVNFDMIRNGTKLDLEKIKQYQTIDHDEMKKFPEKYHQQIYSSIFRNVERKDLHVNGQLIKEHFTNKKKAVGRGKFLKQCKDSMCAKYW